MPASPKSKPQPSRSSARERVLAQWRGVDVAPLESARRVTARPVAALLPKVTAALNLDRRRAEADLVRVWAQLIDPRITAHAQPTGLVRGTLFVSVDSHAWLDEIVRYRRREILDRLQHSFGSETVKKISFRVG